jgi:hypothetical protein
VIADKGYNDPPKGNQQDAEHHISAFNAEIDHPRQAGKNQEPKEQFHILLLQNKPLGFYPKALLIATTLQRKLVGSTG